MSEMLLATLAGRDMGKSRARPGLYQCSSGDCWFQLTVTTHTLLHATKLPLCVWLKAMWLLLQLDKGLSLRATVNAISPQAELHAHLMSDEANAIRIPCPTSG